MNLSCMFAAFTYILGTLMFGTLKEPDDGMPRFAIFGIFGIRVCSFCFFSASFCCLFSSSNCAFKVLNKPSTRCIGSFIRSFQLLLVCLDKVVSIIISVLISKGRKQVINSKGVGIAISPYHHDRIINSDFFCNANRQL